MLLIESQMLPVSLEVGDADVTSSDVADDMDGGEVIVDGAVETSAALHRQVEARKMKVEGFIVLNRENNSQAGDSRDREECEW